MGTGPHLFINEDLFRLNSPVVRNKGEGFRVGRSELVLVSIWGFTGYWEVWGMWVGWGNNWKSVFVRY